MRALAYATMFLLACDSKQALEQPRPQPHPIVEASSTHVATTPPEHDPEVSVPLRVGGDVKVPRLIRKVDPVYPEAQGTFRQGMLILECVISETGDVRDLRVIKGPGNIFEKALLDAVKQWKFKPGTLHGKPVAVIYNLTVNHFPYGPES